MKSVPTKSRRTSSLTAQFAGLLCLAGLASVVLFFFLRTGGETLIRTYFDRVNFQQQYVEHKIDSLQQYVTENNLSAQDADGLNRWVKKTPLTFMAIYRDNVLLYASSAPEQALAEESELEVPYYDWVSYYSVTFADGEAEVVLYTGSTYLWLTYLTVVSLLLSFLFFLAILTVKSRGLVRYIGQLSNQIQAMEGGDLDQAILIRGNNELSRLAQGLDAMRQSFKEQTDREKALFRANQTMITQMSHDLRTPLTALQIYTDILRYRKFADRSQSDEYLNKIDTKVAQIKQLSENIFEYSLVSGIQQIDLEPPRPLRDVFHDALSEMVAYLDQHGFTFALDLDWPHRQIAVYPQYIKRLMDNVISNITKYAEPSVPVSIAVKAEGESVCLSFANAIRPDSSQQDSNRIGLSNMRAMMGRMEGELQVCSEEGTFVVTLCFPARP